MLREGLPPLVLKLFQNPMIGFKLMAMLRGRHQKFEHYLLMEFLGKGLLLTGLPRLVLGSLYIITIFVKLLPSLSL